MELRLLTPDDGRDHDRLMAEAFGRGHRNWDRTAEEAPFKEVEAKSPRLGIFDGVRLVASATYHNLHATWGDHDAPMSGVAGVACTAEQRGRGHVAGLLAEGLQMARDNGQYLSGLYPFAYAFYRKHGWEWVGEKRAYTIPTAMIDSFPEGQHIRPYDGPEALAIVKPLYGVYARRYRGMLTRETTPPNFWSRLDHSDNRSTYVHVYHDPETGDAQGYLTFRYPDGDNLAFCREFVALTPAAYRGLLSVLHYYGTQVRRVGWDAPLDDPLPVLAMHNDLEMSVSKLFMGRIVDVAMALQALTVPVSLTGKLILRVADTTCEWNNATFAVTLENGHVTVTPTRDDPGVTLDIQALTQAYWGQPALNILRSAGRLTITDEAHYALLSALLPPTICFLNDYF